MPLALSQAEPRIPFALFLPFASTSLPFVFSSTFFDDELRLATAANLFSRISFQKACVSIPKSLRLFVQDYSSWRDNTSADGSAIRRSVLQHAISIREMNGNEFLYSPLQLVHIPSSTSTAHPTEIIASHDIDEKSSWDIAENLVGNWVQPVVVSFFSLFCSLNSWS